MQELEYNNSMKEFYITNENNGDIYNIEDDDEIGDIVGEIIDGTPTFYALMK